jgi:hypothetical protein
MASFATTTNTSGAQLSPRKRILPESLVKMPSKFNTNNNTNQVAGYIIGEGMPRQPIDVTRYHTIKR